MNIKGIVFAQLMDFVPTYEFCQGYFFFENKVGEEKIFEKVQMFAHVQKEVFMIELIYSGKSGNNIMILYKEYVNDLERLAFYQNLYG